MQSVATIQGFEVWRGAETFADDHRTFSRAYVSGCKDGDHINACPDDEADFFSGYAFGPQSPSMCVCDFRTRDEAEAYMRTVCARFGWTFQL